MQQERNYQSRKKSPDRDWMKYCEKDGEDIIISSLDINQARYMQQQAYGPTVVPSLSCLTIGPHQMLP